MEAQRREFEARLGRAILATRELLARANGTDPNLRQDARAFFERHGSFPQNRRELGHLAFLMTSIWNRLELGEVTAAQAIVGRDLAVIDQMARGGSTALANLWHHQPEPPWGVVDRPARAELAPYSALVPPILVAASVAYLRDLDAMGERLGHVRPVPVPKPAPLNVPGPKADPKGDGKGRRANAKAKKEAAAALAAAGQPQCVQLSRAPLRVRARGKTAVAAKVGQAA